jgi:hypothetical protein
MHISRSFLPDPDLYAAGIAGYLKTRIPLSRAAFVQTGTPVKNGDYPDSDCAMAFHGSRDQDIICGCRDT